MYKGGFNPVKPAWLYILLLDTPEGLCYGFGITNNLKNRMQDHKLSISRAGCKILTEYDPLYFDDGESVKNKETEWKQSKYTVNTGVTGFRTESVLVNTETTKMIFG